ncbi:MAG: SBBP repeat-containing protein [Bacteroidota bacterium]|nr:SBBP repeat-containing protein [Bacteroidota bacterium]
MKSKKFVLIAFFTTMLLTITSQNPTFGWVKQVGGNSSYAYANAITTDKFGNNYSIGVFTGTVDLDPGAGTFTMASTNPSDYDAYIVKLNASGNFMWAKAFGPATNISTAIECTDIEVDDNGNVILLGYFDEPVDFDPSPSTFSLSALGNNDVFVCKLDNSGNFVWAKQFAGSSSSDYVSCEQALVVDNIGNIAFSGFYTGTVDFDPSAAVNAFTSNGNGDVFICKLNSNGNLIWAKSIGGTQNDEAMTLGIDGSKNIIAGGRFKSQVDFDPNAGITTYTAQGADDSFVLKLDSLGNFVWANTFGSSNISANDRAGNLVVKSNGDVYVSDAFDYVVDFDPSAATATLSPIGINDTYVLKFNANGSFAWVKQVTGSGYMEPKAMDLDFLGNVYVTGYYVGLNDCDPGAGTYTINSSNNAYFIMKLDPNGLYSWARSIDGSSGDELGLSVKIDPNGNIYSTGNFNTNGVDFDPDAGITQLNLSGGGSNDVFILKFNQCLAPFLPTNTTFASLQSICSSSNITTLTATSSGTVTWFNVPSAGSPLGSGTSFVTPTLSIGTHTFYAQANTCTVSASRTPITVTVNPNPAITLVSSSSSICAGESATLTAGGGSNYSWSILVGFGPTVAVTPTATTIFTVTGSNSFNCSNTATISQVVDACVGLKENSFSQEKISVYPNPASDKLIVKAENQIEEILISDLNSKIISRYRLEDGAFEQSIDLNHLSNGLYFVIVKTERGTVNIKLIK